jgi:hypothetical protein
MTGLFQPEEHFGLWEGRGANIRVVDTDGITDYLVVGMRSIRTAFSSNENDSELAQTNTSQ